jgi:hypothetical protein
LRGEVKQLLELVLSSPLGDIVVTVDGLVVKARSRITSVEISVSKRTPIRVAALFFYLYELTGSIFSKYLDCAKRLKDLRSHFDVEVHIYIVDCDVDTKLLTNLLEALLVDFKYNLEKAVNTAALLVMISREAEVVKKLRAPSISKAEYSLYQESLSRVASCLRQLEVQVQSSDELSRLVDLASKAQITGEQSKHIVERALLEEGFTGVHYTSRVLSECSSTIASTVRDLYSRVLSQSGVLVLAPGIMRALLRGVVPREGLVELP